MTCSVAAIVAAAGRSQRMGSCKQLLDLGGKTVLARCIETLRYGGVGEIIVVIAGNGLALADEAGRYPVKVAVNEDPAGDMASSVRVGREILSPGSDGVIVALCDYPLVTDSTISTLVHAHTVHPGSIVIPTHGGRRGHPTLFPATILAELAPGGTLRDLVRCDPCRVDLCDVDDPGILQDMDTPEDYRRIASSFTCLA